MIALSRVIGFLAFASLAFSGTSGSAEPPRYTARVWGQAEGLPVHHVGGIAATPDGYLWFGTLDGLVRFDGVRMSVFDAGNTTGIENNLLPEVGLDAQGRLWAWGTAPWISVLDATGVRTYGTESGLPRVGVRRPRFARDGTVWLAMARGLYVLRGERFVPAHPDLAALNIPSIWVSRAGDVLVFPLDSPAIVLSQGTTAPLGVPTQVVDACETADGAVWMAATDGIYRRAASGAVERIASLTGGRPTAIGADGRGGIWLGTSVGLFSLTNTGLVRLAEAPVEHLNADAGGAVWTSDRKSVRRNGVEVYRAPGDVTSIVADREGNVWLGTTSAGVVRLQEARVDSLATDMAPRGVAVGPDGRVWVANADGVTPADGGEPRYLIPGGAEALTFDREGTMWVAARQLYCLRAGRLDPVAGGGQNVLDVDQTSDGAIWSVMQGELRRWRDGVWKSFGPSSGTSAGPMQFGDEGPDGTLWFTSPEGLLRFHDGRFDLFTEADGLSSNRTRSVQVDSNGTVWIGTEGRGLNRLRTGPGADGRPSSVRAIRESDGLHENGISALALDGSGGLWMGTNRGIVRASLDELESWVAGRSERVHTEVFGARDGLASGSVPTLGGSLVDHHGVLHFATEAGVARIDPARLVPETPPPQALVEEVRVHGVSRPAGREVRLAPGEGEFALSFTAPSFSAPESLTFRYRLVGFRDTWEETGTRRVAYFTNVPPGRYRFEVQAANRSGVWRPGPTTLALVVAPTWYENVWHRRLAAGLALALLALALRFRLRAHERRERELATVVQERTRDLEAEKVATEAAQHAEAAARKQAEAQRAIAEEAMETAQRQAARLWEMDQAKSRFFANVSHEFRTPLTLTIGPLEDVVSGMHGEIGEDAERELQTAIRSSRSVLELVNQILELARLEAGQLTLNATNLDLGPLLRDVGQDFSALAERRGIRFEIHVPDEPLPVRGDAAQLRRVAANLLANAFKFTERGGRVGLHAARTDATHEIAFTVEDSGIGIAREDLDRIFDRFYQAHAGQHSSQPGTGIGLSLASELVELHDGRIEVASERGAGSRFRVVLPLRAAGAEEAPVPFPAASRPAEEAGPSSLASASTDVDDGDRPLLLVVDDNDDLRTLVRKHLVAHFRIAEARDGESALEHARRETPDLVITDVMMPGLDGLGLLRAFREDPTLDFVPVILLTARHEVADRVAAYGLGADGYLAKPFHAAELVANVEAVLRTRQRLHERYKPAGVDASSALRSADEAYLEAATRIIDDHLADESFGVAHLAHLLGQGRSQMFARLGEAAGVTPAELIKRRRLQRAAEMLEAGAGSVGEIAYAVGFKSVSHFSRAFRESYGCTPTERIPGKKPATS